ncbi:TetR/AcrR family transcriptional regulator [Parahaliea aestuarii]|uniref:TetR/AcrR family transcriptional regulator n=1 Tax=Parahaliea aestuarii TaxID=1852021 RepID=UPI00164F1F97|nr:TetR/AcrR family transcriptional regulator [Parahaliea aestuarii]
MPAEQKVAGGQGSRSAATRARLIAVAESLFAERGIQGVSLSEINRASKQRNSNACQYHFGNKDGLLQAIVDKHVPAIAARRNRLLDELEQARALSLEAVVRAWVQPVAEKLEDPDGGRDFIRVNAELTPTHTLAVLRPDRIALRAEGADRLARALQATLAHLPAPLREQRLQLASSLLFHGLADHSRVQEDLRRNQREGQREGRRDSARHDNALFTHSLIDAICAMLASAPSAPTSTRLADVEETATNATGTSA